MNLSEFTLGQLTEIYNTVKPSDAKPMKAFRSKKDGIEKIQDIDGIGGWSFGLDGDGNLTISEAGSSEPQPTEVTDGEPDGQSETVDANEDAVGDAVGESQGGSQDEESGEDEVEDEVEEVATTGAFVKATKEQLAAMDGPTRAKYRKDRRAAARAARKARQKGTEATAATESDGADATGEPSGEATGE